MRQSPNPKVEKYRVRSGAMASNSTYGNNGAFLIPHVSGVQFACVVSDGEGWEHVSAQTLDANVSRIPTWTEMAYIKDLFFEDEETVVQYHVAKSKHLNLHPSVLHLWRPLNKVIPLPPSQMVAPRNKQEIEDYLAGKLKFIEEQ